MSDRPFGSKDSGSMSVDRPRLSRLIKLLTSLLVLIGILGISAGLFGASSLQGAADGTVTASIIIPGAIGLSLLYGIRKFANFAHGELMTIGAYAAFLDNVQLGQNFVFGFW